MRAFALVLVVGCVDVADEHRCMKDEHCTRGGIGGTCEPAGNCSFADADCGANGRRYDEHAGARAGVCVLDTIGATPIGHLKLEDGKDTVRASCAPSGARDAFVEIVSDRSQLLMFDTVPDFEPPFGRTTASAHLSLHRGSCGDPQASEVVCAPPPCGDTYSRLIAPVDPGRYCLVVEESDPAATTEVQLRMLPARRGARILDAPQGVETLVADNTCGQGAVDNQCGPPSDAALFLAPLCPGQYLSATISSMAPLDAVLSIRHGVPQDPGDGACVNNANGQADETFDTPIVGPSDPLWFVVSSASSCGPLSLRYTIKR